MKSHQNSAKARTWRITLSLVVAQLTTT
jgi:hypothetical protein